LFSATSAQIGGENETLRNLLLDANAKIGELDTIKDAVDRLVDPVSKTLRAIEAEKSEKIALQTVLNNTRTVYSAGCATSSPTSRRNSPIRRANATTSSRTSPIRRTCCARRRPSAPRSPSTSPPAEPRSPTWNPSSRTRPARARRCARRTAGSTSG
jgi:hypothetical protein